MANGYHETMESLEYPPVVILCGGRGSRISGVTRDLMPKHLLQASGRTVLERAIEPFLSAQRVILAVGHHGDQIVDFASTHFDSERVLYSREPRPAGPLRALSRALIQHEITGRFIFANGDDVTPGLDISAMLADHEDSGAEATILATTEIPLVKDFVLTSDATHRATSLKRTKEIADRPELEPVSYGVGTFVCEQSALTPMETSADIESFMRTMLAERRLGVHAVDLSYYNINRLEDLQYLSSEP